MFCACTNLLKNYLDSHFHPFYTEKMQAKTVQNTPKHSTFDPTTSDNIVSLIFFFSFCFPTYRNGSNGTIIDSKPFFINYKKKKKTNRRIFRKNTSKFVKVFGTEADRYVHIEYTLLNKHYACRSVHYIVVTPNMENAFRYRDRTAIRVSHSQ